MKRLLKATVNWVSWHRRLVGAALAAVSILMLGNALATPEGPTVPAVTVAAALPAGHTLTAADLLVAEFPPEAVPDGAPTDTADLVGRSTAVALGEGSILQPALLATSHSTEPGRALVPIALRDEGLRALLHPGDRITLIATGFEDATVLTSDARVGVLSTPTSGSSPLSIPSTQAGSLILVDVPAADAPMVATLGQDGGIRVVLGGL